MKKIIIIISILIIITIGNILLINKIKQTKQNQYEKRYAEIKNDINNEMNRYLYYIAPNCSSENAGGQLTHKDLVYNNGFDKEKLLDTDKKSYCKVFIKYKCIENGIWNWNTYISCKNHTDKEYEDWDLEFTSKK